MLRCLLATTAVFTLALPAAAQDAEVGKEYEITIETEEENPYTGPFGRRGLVRSSSMCPRGCPSSC